MNLLGRLKASKVEPAKAVMHARSTSGSADRLNAIARLAEARRYLEIGVSEGTTFFEIDVAEKVAVDPRFMFDTGAKSRLGTSFFAMPSDAYFKTARPEPFDVIFLDGLHTYEQTLRDFINTLAHAHDRTIWLLDDTVPNDNFSALPDQERCYRLRRAMGNGDWAWMGDVFKVVFFIRSMMRQFQYRTFHGRGQTIIWRDLSGFTENRGVPLDRIGQMTFEDFREHYAAMMNLADDTDIFSDIRAFLDRS